MRIPRKHSPPSHAASISLHAPVTDQPNNPSEPSPRPQRPRVQPSATMPVAAPRAEQSVAQRRLQHGQVCRIRPKNSVLISTRPTRPHQVVARVVLTPANLAELRPVWRNIGNYTRTFRPPADAADTPLRPAAGRSM